MQKPLLILIIGLIIFSFSAWLYLNQGDQGPSLEEANERAMNFINDILLSHRSTKASLVDISEDHGLIKIDVEIEGQPLTSYMSDDLELFFAEAINIDEYTQLVQSDELPPTEEPSEGLDRPENFDQFISCLSEHEMLIYGADWCGYTNQLVDLLGGLEMIDQIYVECTQEEDLCQEAQITGYPTIRFAGEDYNGPRTLEGLAEVTGCQLIY